VDPEGAAPRKIGALGLRIERGVSYHGIALNVSVDLADFDLIDPCGMPGLISTSIAEELGRTAEPPSTAAVEAAGTRFAEAFATALKAPLRWKRATTVREAAAAVMAGTAGSA
jgi:lipoate-protein ligase B